MFKEANAVLMPLEPTQSMLLAMREINEKWYNPANAAMMYKERHIYAALIKIAQKACCIDNGLVEE